MSDRHDNPPDRSFSQAGVGMYAMRMCMGPGCGRPKSLIGSEGVGVQWRCIDCLSARRAKAAAKAAELNNVKEEA